MTAFENFKVIKEYPSQQDRLRAWLLDYDSLHFSIGKNGNDLIHWKEEKDKYVYSNDLWKGWCEEVSILENEKWRKQYVYASDINKIQRHKRRLVIEFDDKDISRIPKHIEKVKTKLKNINAGFIESTHKGKSNYIWVEFTRDLTSDEAKSFLVWIAPNDSEIDLNFSSDNFRFPILFASHWKHGYNEEPVYFFEGEQIDYDSLGIKQEKIISRAVKDYETYVKKTIGKKEESKELDFPIVSLENYKKKLHEWFYFTDNEIIDVQLSTLIGEKIPGDPLWMFVIAPPGALKTETLRSFTLCQDFFPLSDLTSKTFVSGLMLGKGEKRRKIEDLLPQLNGKVLIFKDFTTVLEKNSDERAEIFAQLREIYDGSFSKKFGTMDQTVRYDSRFGLIAGVTPIIDKHWKLMQQLGERFLKIRWDEDIDKVTKRSRENEGKEKEMRAEMEKFAMGFITNLDYSIIPEFDDDLYGETLDKIAKFVAIARTPVTIQDYRTDFYFDYIPTPERPTRLVKQFKKLARSLSLIRGKKEVDNNEIKTILRVARDTIPQDRMKILEIISKNENITLNGCSKSLICQKIKLPETSTQRVLEQLKMLDLITCIMVEEESFGYKKQTYFYKTTDFVKFVYTPPSYTVGCQKKQEGNTQEKDIKIDFTELDGAFKHE